MISQGLALKLLLVYIPQSCNAAKGESEGIEAFGKRNEATNDQSQKENHMLPADDLVGGWLDLCRVA